MVVSSATFHCVYQNRSIKVFVGYSQIIFYFSLLMSVSSDTVPKTIFSITNHKMKVKVTSPVQLFATPWIIQSMEFSRPEYWSEYPFSSPGDLPNPGIKPRSASSPAKPQGKPKNTGVGSLSCLQQIFPTQESNRGLLHCR